MKNQFLSKLYTISSHLVLATALLVGPAFASRQDTQDMDDALSGKDTKTVPESDDKRVRKTSNARKSPLLKQQAMLPEDTGFEEDVQVAIGELDEEKPRNKETLQAGAAEVYDADALTDACRGCTILPRRHIEGVGWVYIGVGGVILELLESAHRHRGTYGFQKTDAVEVGVDEETALEFSTSEGSSNDNTILPLSGRHHTYIGRGVGGVVLGLVESPTVKTADRVGSPKQAAHRNCGTYGLQETDAVEVGVDEETALDFSTSEGPSNDNNLGRDSAKEEAKEEDKVVVTTVDVDEVEIHSLTNAEEQQYLDNYSDLRSASKNLSGEERLDWAGLYYLKHAGREGRTYQPQANSAAATAEELGIHELTDEEALQYLDNYPDLQKVYGKLSEDKKLAKLKAHYLTHGHGEGRHFIRILKEETKEDDKIVFTTVDVDEVDEETPLDFSTSEGPSNDNNLGRDSGKEEAKEGDKVVVSTVDVDEVEIHSLTNDEAKQYLENYPDLQAASEKLSGAKRLDWARRHYLKHGHKERRIYDAKKL